MKPHLGIWRKTSRHIGEYQFGADRHWLRLPSPPRQLALRALCVGLGERPDKDAPLDVRAAYRARELAVYGALVGAAWGSHVADLDVVEGPDLAAYGLAVWDDLWSADATEEQVVTAGIAVLEAISGSTGPSQAQVTEAQGF